VLVAGEDDDRESMCVIQGNLNTKYIRQIHLKYISQDEIITEEHVGAW